MMAGDWKLPWTGGCRCGRVRFEVSTAPILSMACHCNGCQTMSASAFSLSLMIPAAGFRLTKGETTPGGLQDTLDHRFCVFCKTWMLTAFNRAEPYVNLRPTMLDDHHWFEPFVESCTADKLSWAKTGAPNGFEGFPPPQDRLALIAAFAEHGARPK